MTVRPYVDACPACGRRGNRPIATYRRRGELVAGYHCRPCGHRWTTSWDVYAAEGVA